MIKYEHTKKNTSTQALHLANFINQFIDDQISF